MNRIALNFELPAPSAANPVPDWLELVPAGRITGRDGRSWVNDQPDSVLAYNHALKRDVVVDIEHASELQAPQGKPAPAAGWITELQNRAGAIWGRVDWNASGLALITNREYRYYSPAFLYDAAGRVCGIASVGLTNKHNLELPALNHQSTTTEDVMSLSAAIRQALRLQDDATEADAVIAIGNLHQTALNAQQAVPPLDKFVPRADHDLVVAQVGQLQTALNAQTAAKLDEEITALIDGAIEAKKIAPASREHYVALCHQSGTIEHVKHILEKSPALLTDTHLDTQQAAPHATALNAEQQQINAMFGNSAKDIATYGK